MSARVTLTYRHKYQTKGGKHRYGPVGKPKVSLGDIYLIGLAPPPPRLRITIEDPSGA